MAMKHATASRQLVWEARFASLATLQEGYPFASLVEVACDQQGRPLLLISDLAEHTRNLRQDSRASLLVSPHLDLAQGRCTLLGTLAIVEEGLDNFLAKHPSAAQYASFKDFHLWGMQVEKVRYVGGFGAMSWVSGEDYAEDPLAELAESAITHMNEDHADALQLLAQKACPEPVTSVLMTDCDHTGYVLQINQERSLRLAFEQPIWDADALRQEFVRQVRAARG
jgi:putative heme iron utilization protein